MKRWLIAAFVGASFLTASAPAFAAGPSVTVTPTGRVRDGQTVTVSVAGAPAGATLLAVECAPIALEISEDGCENHRDAVFFADAAGDATTTLIVTSAISTAVGPESCTTATCLLGVVRFTSPTDDSIIGAAALSFSSATCHGGTACEDAPAIPSTRAPAHGSVPRVKGATVITPSKPYTHSVPAVSAPSLRSPAAITGPYKPSAHAGGIRIPGVRGEGIVELGMAGPRTSWASDTDKAVVVSARVDRGPWQQVVLFAGSTPFTYAGFVGPLAEARHHVSIRVDRGLSSTGRHLPAVALYGVRLLVVTPKNPMYLLEKYAPLIYGRATSASSDTQLLTDGTATPIGGGSTALSFTTIWTHEDAGTSFVPFLEWGEWGRMTDITGTASLDVSATGKISNATYNWCGCEPGFPPGRDSLQEVSVPFEGHYFDGTHMILRNASGNDYQSDVGTTGFRFQQPAVPGPQPGQPRESVMDSNPWTYRIMDQEVSSWYLDRSTDPNSAQPGTTSQYAIASLDTTVPPGTTVAVDLQLSGSSTWYRSDMGSGAPLYTGGLGRTVVKLPVGWESHRITAVQLAVYPASATSSAKLSSFKLLGLTSTFQIKQIPTPKPTIVPTPSP